MLKSTVAKVVVGVTACAAAFGMLPTNPASASQDQCPRGSFCAWEWDNWQGYNGRFYKAVGHDANWHTGLYTFIGNNAESVSNNGYTGGNDHVWLFNDINHHDVDVCVRPGYDLDTSTWATHFDDNEYSSHAWHSACSSVGWDPDED